MSDCERRQEEMDEILALGGEPSDFSESLRSHLAGCEECRAFCNDGLLLNQALEEPTPLPPADLVGQVMSRISEDEASEPRLPWAERLAWAASGAVGMFCVERIPEYSSGWWAGMEQLLVQAEWSFRAPVAVSATTMALTAGLLFLGQAVLVYRTRATAS